MGPPDANTITEREISDNVITKNTTTTRLFLIVDPSSASEIAAPELLPGTPRLNKTLVTTGGVSLG